MISLSIKYVWVLLFLLAHPAGGTNYFVSPSGDDDNDGQSEANAWLSIDNGDKKDLLVAGDTINVLPGLYNITEEIQLTTSGSSDHKITYRRVGDEPAILDANNLFNNLLVIEASHIVLSGLDFSHPKDDGISIKGDSCRVLECYVYNCSRDGIRVEGIGVTLLRNIVAGINEHGLNIRDGADNCEIYNNTIYSCGKNGIETPSKSVRIFNNLIIDIEKGINGKDENICGFNDIWNNSSDAYAGGAEDSAGGLNVDPMFLNAAAGDFILQEGSPVINAGMDLGYGYYGSAPDMGARESSWLASLEIIPYYDSLIADSNYLFDFLALDDEGYDADPGTLSWSHTFVTGSIDSTGLFTPELTGLGQIIVESSVDGITDTSEIMTVVPGTPVSLTVSPDSCELTTDETQAFTASGLDVNGNTADPGDLAWEVIGLIGNIDGEGLFDPTTIGSGQIAVTSSINGITDTNTAVIVTPGNLDSLYITPNTDTVSTDDARQFTAWGYDADGNAVSDLGVLTWMVLRAVGTIDSTGLFQPTKIGYTFIKVLSDLGPLATSDTIFVIHGEVAYIDVIPDNNVVEEGKSAQYTAYGFDADSNLAGDLTDSVTWSTTDPTGSVSVAGLYTAGSIISPPLYYVKGEYKGTLTDSGSVSVVTDGSLSYILLENLDGTPADDMILTTDVDTTKIFCRGYDSGDNLLGDVSIDWSIISDDTIGTVLSGPQTFTILTLTKPGTGEVVGLHSSGMADTTGIILSGPGIPVSLDIDLDSATVSADSAIQFSVVSLDADGNESDPSVMPNWAVLGDIGSIDTQGWFTPSTAGIGSVACSGAGLADTVGPITVIPGMLQYLEITPDTATIDIGDSIQFTALGYDAKANLTDAGELSWQVLGLIGTIDGDGFYTAVSPGICSVMVTSDIGGVYDISGAVAVEGLTVSGISTGSQLAYPGQTDLPLLGWQLNNQYKASKNITGLIVRDASLGAGNEAERLSNIDTLSLYLDLDNDSAIGPADSLIAQAAMDAETVAFAFTAIEMPPAESYAFIVGGNVGLYPHDSDSLDLFLIKDTDISIDGDPAIAGPETINPNGYGIVDGLVANQISQITTGLSSIGPDGQIHNVLTIDIPRNGYRSDTLNIFSLVNTGSAAAADVDSMILYRDDGNLSWDGPDLEIPLGLLVHTGSQWTRSGLDAPLTQPMSRFFVGAKLSDYPADGATLTVTIPRDGLEMSSDNDGPIDASLEAVDTIVISSSESVNLQALAITARELIPGETTAPLTAIELTNGRAAVNVIDSLRLTLYAVDPLGATQEQLDSQIDSVLIYLKGDDNYNFIGPDDSLLGSAPVVGGEALFNLGGLSVPGSGGIATLSIVARLNLQNAKNGNTVNFGLADMSAIYSNAPVITGSFPLANNENHLIDAFPAGQLVINPVEGMTLFGAQVEQPVLDFELPRDGYSAGVLAQLRLTNIGTLTDVEALDGLYLWADMSDDGFTADDSLLGALTYSSGNWNLKGISYPLTDGSTRFIATVDVTDFQFVGGTLRFEIPIEGARMWSGTTGPDDMTVGNADAHLVFPANRVTAISIPSASQTVAPGSAGNIVFTYALYNGYTNKSQLLQTINLSNISRSSSGLAYADHELGQVRLYLDADNNRIYDNDSMVAVGQFADGALQMTGLDVSLDPENLYYFFVLADIPLGVIDSDSLAVSIASPTDLVFAEQVNINGDLPLTSGGYSVVDGSVRNQYEVIELQPRTLSPGDTSVVLFAFRPAGNGIRPDTLHSLTLTNVDDADTGDVSSLRLWLDINDDDLWQTGDSLIGTFSYTGSEWHIDDIALEVDTLPSVLFAVGDISATVSADARFKAEIPIDGCVYYSDNDGPRDVPLTAVNTFTMSYSALRVDFLTLPETFSIGQTIAVRITATNLSDLVTMDSVCAVITPDSPAIVTLIDSAGGCPSLGPGQSADFTYYYLADTTGIVTWQIRAVAPTIPDSSAVVQTNPVTIQTLPSDVTINLINSIPASVTQGQTNIFPLSINLAHPNSSAEAASLRLDSLELSVTDGSGLDVAADEVFSRLILTAGIGVISVWENVPISSSIPFAFSEPVIIPPGGEAVLSLLVNIDSAAAVDDFMLSVKTAEAIPVIDENTMMPVAIDAAVAFPLQTASCRIDIPSRQMVVSSSSVHGGAANFGQNNVEIMRLQVRHPDTAGSSQIQFGGFTLAVVDDSNTALVASEILNQITVARQATVIGGLGPADLEGVDLEIQFNAPVTLSPEEIDSLSILVSINEVSAYSTFALAIADSSDIQVRDLSSGSLLDVATDTLLSAGSAFPMTTDPVMLTYPALPPNLCLVSSIPASVVGGADGLDLLELAVAYPYGDNLSPIRMNGVLVSVLDTLGRPLDPDRLFDRIGVSLADGAIAYQPYVRLQDGAAAFDFDENGLTLSPGDSLAIRLIGDIEADAPFDHFLLRISAETAIESYDVNDPAYCPGFLPAPDCGLVFPFTSAVTKIFLPAGRPDIVFDELPVHLAYPGQTGLDVYDGGWTYDASIPLGELAIHAVQARVLRRTVNGQSAAAGGIIFEAVHLWLNDQIVGSDTVLDGDTLQMIFDEEFLWSRGTNLTMRLTCDISENAPLGNYLIQFGDSTFMEMTDRNLGTEVYPRIAGGDYPVYSAEISLTAADLGGSFTNYPNPFQPSRDGATTIGFVLTEDAYIDIELFSITGEAVKQLVMNSFRSASEYAFLWGGLNDADLEVVPGTYFCRITARYISGREETFRRKIAVIR